MKLFGDKPEPQRREDRFDLKIGPDGNAGTCYFCGAQVSVKDDFAVLMVERVEPRGDPIHSVCHGTCAERAKTF